MSFAIFVLDHICIVQWIGTVAKKVLNLSQHFRSNSSLDSSTAGRCEGDVGHLHLRSLEHPAKVSSQRTDQVVWRPRSPDSWTFSNFQWEINVSSSSEYLDRLEYLDMNGLVLLHLPKTYQFIQLWNQFLFQSVCSSGWSYNGFGSRSEEDHLEEEVRDQFIRPHC